MMVQVMKGPKVFDSWNSDKKLIHFSEASPPYFKEREIWWCALGVNVGVETDGKNDNFERPVLLLAGFNKEMAWVLPITSRSNKSRFYYPLEYEGQKQWIILSQIRTISTKRLLRKIRVLSEEEFGPIVNLIIGFLKKANETPPDGGESRRPKP
ncbi:MAG TPA: type II toxin-antitoxin system PemK/MazF family toxin [Candidatus Paceibacterota bacterium]